MMKAWYDDQGNLVAVTGTWPRDDISLEDGSVTNSSVPTPYLRKSKTKGVPHAKKIFPVDSSGEWEGSGSPDENGCRRSSDRVSDESVPALIES